MDHFGALSLIPAVLFLVLALVTRKTITSIVISGLSGYILYYKGEFLWPTIDHLVTSMTDYDNMWIVLVCMLFGSLICLLREAKGTIIFGNFAKKYANTPKKGLMATWMLGVVIFVDDYLSILATANTLMPVTDAQKTPREMITYVINTTSAPVCVIIPISAWVVFFSGIFEKQPEAAVLGETGQQIYYHIMPYFFYPFLCVLFVPLVILGIVPKMGGMKKAYERVARTGKLWPESSDILNRPAGEPALATAVGSGAGVVVPRTEAEAAAPPAQGAGMPRLWSFVAPMGLVIAVTVWQEDIMLGVIIGIIGCLSFIPTRIMTFSRFCDCCLEGLQDMTFIAVVLVTSLFYRESMLLVGLPDYVIEVAQPLMSPALLPLIVFIAVGLVCFATGNIWSIPALTTPIVVPLAAAIGANLPLTLGAIISAAVFGAQACFYSDVTLLSSSACRVSNVDYAIAQLPYIIIVSILSAILFAVAGFVL
jgi:Na+/H+ antiporter NhaC